MGGKGVTWTVWVLGRLGQGMDREWSLDSEGRLAERNNKNA